ARPTRYSGLAFSPALPGEQKIKGLATAPLRGKRPADKNDVVSILNPDTGKVILQLQGRNDAVFDPGGRWLAGGNAGGSVTVYESVTGMELRRLGGRDPSQPSESGQSHYSHRLAVSADGVRLVSGGLDGTVQVWNSESGELTCSWRAHPRSVECVS